MRWQTRAALNSLKPVSLGARGDIAQMILAAARQASGGYLLKILSCREVLGGVPIGPKSPSLYIRLWPKF
ncbi:hypothetical protein [Geopsychrobacter electrodiphilus]|uniref:hypothetical protein n=1 Tax=Geopsychrobacter electrodiphilus TaxID=225196 RepID=UPI0012EC0ECA|nr:hypothetical protein [Geopsychrobacter electrodiphilus]